jgi:phosphatidylglycerol:prolipoprotein diacylglycerol transferase
MKPVLFHLGPIVIRSWGVLVALGVLVGLYFARRVAVQRHIDGEKILDLSFYLLLSGLIGGRVIFVLLELPYFMSNPAEILMVQLGGMAIHGAIIGGVLAVYIFARLNKISFLRLLDVLSPALLLGQAIGRIGCFLNGDDFGKVTKVFWAVKFPDIAGLRHPTQLYETFADLAVLPIALLVIKKSKKDGEPFFVVAIMYSVIRFVLEFFRADMDIAFANLTYAQIASIVIVLIGLGGLAYQRLGRKEITVSQNVS